MKIIEYFTSKDKAYWLDEIAKAEWDAAKFLHYLLSEGKLKETVGDSALVPLLTDGKKLVSFCTLAPLDDVQPTALSPWIGFVYTAPEYRGHHYVGELLKWAEEMLLSHLAAQSFYNDVVEKSILKGISVGLEKSMQIFFCECFFFALINF